MIGADVVNGIPLVWIGENGEVFTSGHDVDADAFIAAIDYDAEDRDMIERAWLVAKPHRDDCEDFDADGEDACWCDEYAWWASFLSDPEESAHAVTVYRS